MTISISPRFGLTLWESEDDQVTWEQFTSNFSAIEALGAQCVPDVFANRPAPGQGQRFFYATDQRVLYFDTGGSWVVVLFTPDTEFTSTRRPAAGSDGRYVWEPDTARLFRDTGSRYVEILTSTVIPAGIILPSLSAVLPSGWLFCDGSAYPPGQYPDLYQAIGTRYGSSGTNFMVPDFRGLFLAGSPTLGASGFGGVGAHDHGLHAHSIPNVGDMVEEQFVATLPIAPDGEGNAVFDGGINSEPGIASLSPAIPYGNFVSATPYGPDTAAGDADWGPIYLDQQNRHGWLRLHVRNAPTSVGVVNRVIATLTYRVPYSATEDSGASTVPEAGDILSYGYASYLIKATGGVSD